MEERLSQGPTMEQDSGDSQRTGMVQWWRRIFSKLQNQKTPPQLVNDLSPSHLAPFKTKLKRMVRLAVMAPFPFFHPKLIGRRSHSENQLQNASLAVETRRIKKLRKRPMGKQQQPTLTSQITLL